MQITTIDFGYRQERVSSPRHRCGREGRCQEAASPRSATLSFYATKDGKISISFSGWDSNKVALESVSEATDCASGTEAALLQQRRHQILSPSQNKR
jgi:hypothetical protein